MALAGRKFRFILVGMVAAFLVVAGPAGAQQNEAVCQAVINIIINNSPGNQIDDQYATGDNINAIAQELNVSPVIVQKCAEAGGVDIEEETTNGTTNGTTDETTNGTTDEDTDGTTGDDNGDTVPEDVILDSIPDKNLPVTGGLELWTGGALLLGAGLMVWRIVNRRS